MENYDKLDVLALTNLLLNPDNKADVHRGALSALTRVDPLIRNSRLIAVLQNVVRHAGRYDQEVMESIIDILATDPDADATVAMIENLSGVLEAGLEDKLTPDFRQYYYTALLTRQREDDLEVWGEMLPNLEPPTLVAMMLDSQAQPLVEAIDPLELLSRLPEPDRTRNLFRAIVAVIERRTGAEYLNKAIKNLRESNEPKSYQKGVDQLIDMWGNFKKDNSRSKSVSILEKMLKVLDREPRNARERLTGKRPWAP